MDFPVRLQHSSPPTRLPGSGNLAWFGLHLDDVALWMRKQAFDCGRAFALAIGHTRDFESARIAERGAAEMEWLGVADAAEAQGWEQ